MHWLAVCIHRITLTLIKRKSVFIISSHPLLDRNFVTTMYPKIPELRQALQDFRNFVRPHSGTHLAASPRSPWRWRRYH